MEKNTYTRFKDIDKKKKKRVFTNHFLIGFLPTYKWSNIYPHSTEKNRVFFYNHYHQYFSQVKEIKTDTRLAKLEGKKYFSILYINGQGFTHTEDRDNNNSMYY